MRLRLLAKDGGSGDIGCPSVHHDDDSGDLVFQGDGVSMEHMPNALPGEQAVRLRPDIVRAAAREMGWL